MRILELFSGTASVGNEFRKRGHQLFTVDNDKRFKPSWCRDVLTLTAEDLLAVFPDPDVVWCSPPCQGFSTNVIGRNWESPGVPKSESAKKGMHLVTHTLTILDWLENVAGFPELWWFLENPRAMLRSVPFMKPYPRETVTYCQYGDTRMKPTDIWGNRLPELNLRSPCKNGDPCHEPAPRSSNLGTRGRSRVDAGKIPREFGRQLCIQIERVTSKTGVE